MADRGPKWFWNALGGTGSIEGKFVRQKTSTRKIAEIEFQSEQWGKTVKTFETFIKPYEEAMLLYSSLPEIPTNGGWKWYGSPKALRAANRPQPRRRAAPLDCV